METDSCFICLSGKRDKSANTLFRGTMLCLDCVLKVAGGMELATLLVRGS
jgi:hypothetical protein